MKQIKEFDYAKLLRIVLLVILDTVLINVCNFLSLLVRMEMSLRSVLDSGFLTSLEIYAPVHTVCTLVIFWLFRLYKSLWEYAGPRELLRITAASVVSSVVQYLGLALVDLPVPRSLPIINALLLTAVTGCSRWPTGIHAVHSTAGDKQPSKKRTMLIGAGDAGALALREFQGSQHSGNKVVCIIDDAPRKQGQASPGRANCG